jgi:hypothetical protein
VTLDREDIEAVAARVVELLEERHAAPASGLVSAAVLARRLGVERGWVYAHQDELGVVRLGEGPKAGLRFDLERATACLADRRSGGGATTTVEPKSRRARGRRSRSAGTNVDLLPVKRPIVPRRAA